MRWRLGNVDDIAWSIEFAALWKGAPASLHGKARSLSQSQEGDLFERSFGPRLQALGPLEKIKHPRQHLETIKLS